ncbi:restriction endonuclease subunit S [Thiolapillus sp.]|uniref:restriction endonuclease subunit S n=3 Tax=Thiolapillus sp. TaxID=2017437 RepID=UPI003AF810ED
MEQLAFPKYENYKPSGIEWVGEIPAHWGTQKGKWLFKKVERPVRPEDKIVTAFRDGTVTLRSNRRTEGFTNAIQEHGYQGIRKGDLVIHAMDAFAGAIGVSDSEGKATPVYAACVGRGEFKTNNQYFAYLLRFISKAGYILALAKGIRERSTDFRFNDFGKLLLPLPPKAEQDRIANFLDRKTAEIDEAIAKKLRLIELLKEQKAILINQAVTKGLNPDAPMRDSGVEWIGEVPKHWEIKRLGFLAKMLQTGPFGSQLHQEDYIEDGIPVINPSQLSNGKIVPDSKTTVSEKTARRLHRHMTMVGDIIFARRGEMGRCGLTTQGHEGYICGTGSILFRPNKLADSVFLTIALGSDFIRRFLQFVSVGATMDNLNTSILSKVPIPIPPKEEQLRIIDAVVQIQAEHQEVAKTLQIGINQLYEFKQSAIASVVTGKIKL